MPALRDFLKIDLSAPVTMLAGGKLSDDGFLETPNEETQQYELTRSFLEDRHRLFEPATCRLGIDNGKRRRPAAG
jgi:hypothetical protein